MRGVKTDDSYEDSGFEASKTTTVTRMATPGGSFEARGGGGGEGIPLGGRGEGGGGRTENREHI